MRIIGIDPGLRITGYACVQGDAIRPAIVEAGVLRLGGSGHAAPIEDRIEELHRDVAELIARVKPEALDDNKD